MTLITYNKRVEGVVKETYCAKKKQSRWCYAVRHLQARDNPCEQAHGIRSRSKRIALVLFQDAPHYRQQSRLRCVVSRHERGRSFPL